MHNKRQLHAYLAATLVPPLELHALYNSLCFDVNPFNIGRATATSACTTALLRLRLIVLRDSFGLRCTQVNVPRLYSDQVLPGSNTSSSADPQLWLGLCRVQPGATGLADVQSWPRS